MLPKIETILYCTDLSKNASYAFKYAVTLAKETGTKIHILHVVEKLSNDARIALKTYVMNEKSRDEILNKRRDHAKELLSERQNIFWLTHVTEEEKQLRKQIVSIDIVESYPAESILKKSKELSVDLIVMGTHEKGLMHTFLGSVAKSVIHRSKIPTLVIPLPGRDELIKQKEHRLKIKNK